MFAWSVYAYPFGVDVAFSLAKYNYMHMNQTQTAFNQLVNTVHNCHLCPRMEGRTRVLGPRNGPVDALVLFVAEAPGRLGADRLGIPLSGDQTGRSFENLLQAAQLDRREVFITNAVLCNPRNEQGNNAPPTSLEIRHCSQHLSTTIQILQPQFVVTLGQVALKALQHIEQHTLVLSTHVGVPHRWYDRWLIPLYHPGLRARLHRPLELQLADFHALGSFIHAPFPNRPSLGDSIR